jgi:hypothetical protein
VCRHPNRNGRAAAAGIGVDAPRSHHPLARHPPPPPTGRDQPDIAPVRPPLCLQGADFDLTLIHETPDYYELVGLVIAKDSAQHLCIHDAIAVSPLRQVAAPV